MNITIRCALAAKIKTAPPEAQSAAAFLLASLANDCDTPAARRIVADNLERFEAALRG